MYELAIPKSNKIIKQVLIKSKIQGIVNFYLIWDKFETNSKIYFRK